MKLKQLVVAACAAALIGSSAAAPSNAQESTLLTVAFIGAASGTTQGRDQALYNAALLAAENINDDGLSDVDGNSYRLTVKYYAADSQNDIADVLDDVESDKAIAVLAPADDERLQVVVDDAGITEAILTAAHNAPTDSNVFRLAATESVAATAVADYLVNRRYFTKIAAVAVDTQSAQDGMATFKAEAGSGLLVADLTHQADDTDFAETARTIRDSRAEVVFAWTLDVQMQALMTALGEVGWDGMIVYRGLDEEFIARVGADQAAHLMGPMQWITGAYDADSQDFVTEYRVRFNEIPTLHAAAYYDAVKLLGVAIAERGDDPAAISAELRELSLYDGVNTLYRNGQAEGLFIAEVMESGALVEVARYDDDGATCLNCAQTARPDVSANTVNARASLTVAVIGTFDSLSEHTGDSALKAAQMAAREINERGGIVGPNSTRYTINVVGYPANSSAEAEKAIKDAKAAGAAVILGPDFNGHLLPALNTAAQSTIAQLTSATTTDATENDVDDYVFQLRTHDAELATAAVRYLVDERELTRFATLAVRTDYGIGTADAIKSAIDASDDGRVVLSLEHDVDHSDYAALAAQIAGANVQAVFAWTTQPAFESLLAELGKLNWTGTLVYGYATSDLLNSLEVPPSIDLIASVNWWPSAGDWASADFATRYASRYGTLPTAHSVVYYDALYLLSEGVAVNGADAARLRTWLTDVETFRGVQGVYRPASYGSGELSRSVVLLIVTSSEVRELARYDNGVLLAR